MSDCWKDESDDVKSETSLFFPTVQSHPVKEIKFKYKRDNPGFSKQLKFKNKRDNSYHTK